MGRRPHSWTRRIGGVVAESVDGRVWTWIVANTVYRWCKLGHLELVSGKKVARVGFFRDLQSALSWSIGYHDGLHELRNGKPLGL